MIPLKEAKYRVQFKDAVDKEHNVSVVARSSTHAILVAMEEVSDLKLHPDRIYHVSKED